MHPPDSDALPRVLSPLSRRLSFGYRVCALSFTKDGYNRDHRSRAHGTSFRSPGASLRYAWARGTYRADNEGD
ncbi:hypothetical protein THIOKS13320065 [Thiocapsa sp. KS1]|nr:hypothetical protein THIOKS13320065 [Thiocapsa sp. KS1]